MADDSSELTLSAAKKQLFSHAKAGVLMKRGFAWRRKWVKRWVALSGRKLHYFVHSDATPSPGSTGRRSSLASTGRRSSLTPRTRARTVSTTSTPYDEEDEAPHTLNGRSMLTGHHVLPPTLIHDKLPEVKPELDAEDSPVMNLRSVSDARTMRASMSESIGSASLPVTAVPRGSLELTHMTVVEDAEFSGYEHCFAVRPQAPAPVWYLAASSAEDKAAWMAAIARSVFLVQRAGMVATPLPNQGSIGDHYTLGNLVRRFPGGGLHVAKHRRTGDLVTVRVFEKVVVKASERECRRLSVVQQAALRLKHPSLARCVEVYDAVDATCLVFDNLAAPNIVKHLAASKCRCYTETVVASIVSQVAAALATLHARGIVHRAVTWSNVRLRSAADDSDDVSGVQVELGGFEAACRTLPAVAHNGATPASAPMEGFSMDDIVTPSMLDAAGCVTNDILVEAFMSKLTRYDTVMAAGNVHDDTLGCMPASHDPTLALPSHALTGSVAPEVLQTGVATPAADMWALGVLMYTLLVGYPPPRPATDAATAVERLKGGAMVWHTDHWADVGDGAKQVLAGLLQPLPVLRTTASAVLEHPWVKRTEASAALDIPLANAHRRLGVMWDAASALATGLPAPELPPPVL